MENRILGIQTDDADADRPVSFGSRISALARAHPQQTAIFFFSPEGAETRIPWVELDKNSNQMARLLALHGVGQGSMVVVGLPNRYEHFLVTIGTWKLGGCVLPLKPVLPARERNQILGTAGAQLVVADWDQVSGEVARPPEVQQFWELPDDALPDRISHPGKAVASGGSTGRPKIIVDPKPWALVPGEIYQKSLGRLVGMRSLQTQLVAGPLYHNAPFCWSHWGLFEDHKLVVMERFDAALAADLLERFRVNFAFFAPTMMLRMIRLPDIKSRDFSAAESFWHSAAPCPIWVKQAWIDLIGPEKLNEAYGATEGVGFASIRGDDWLQHRGSVGLPRDTDVRILDENGEELPTGEVGEIFTRLKSARDTAYSYLGSPPARTTADGFSSVGDMGWVDEQGYLYIADRRVDLIISGGANVYPAEVEAMLVEFPGVLDVAVIGVPDEDWGKRVHAVIQAANPNAPPSVKDLDQFCRQSLASYKVPKSYEFVEALPRDEAGKIRRSTIASERQRSWTENMLAAPRLRKETV
jgi:bile acid-coenzyme A ligase